MKEGSGSRAGSGSIPLTSGSGSGRPKNTWIRWIRIRNTAYDYQELAQKTYFSELVKELKPGVGAMSGFLGLDMRWVNTSSFPAAAIFNSYKI